MDERHWSRTGGGADLTAAQPRLSGGEQHPVAGYGALPPTEGAAPEASEPDAAPRSKPGFSGAAGNAC